MDKKTWMEKFIEEMIYIGVCESIAEEEAEYQWDHVADDTDPKEHAEKIASSYI